MVVRVTDGARLFFGCQLTERQELVAGRCQEILVVGRRGRVPRGQQIGGQGRCGGGGGDVRGGGAGRGGGEGVVVVGAGTAVGDRGPESVDLALQGVHHAPQAGVLLLQRHQHLFDKHTHSTAPLVSRPTPVRQTHTARHR